MLFRNRGNIANILLRIGESCATNCYNCNDARKPVKFFPYSDFARSIGYVGGHFEPDFSLFFYGIEAIWHPDLELFLSDPVLSRFTPALHITPSFTPRRAARILELAKGFPRVTFDTCYYVSAPDELAGTLRFLDFSVKRGLSATIDIFCHLPAFLPALGDFFRARSFSYRRNDAPSHLHMPFNLEFRSGNLVVEVYQIRRQVVADGRITNLPNHNCLVRRMFRVDEAAGAVDVLEELEVDFEGNLKVHMNAYCSRAIHRISHVDRPVARVLGDFRELSRRLEKYDHGDMGANCHSCSTEPIWIE